ncbi:MAG TPA: hypothetical protein VEJ87_03845, partial [Acidimicrobiales bacterium]|nr:hypothetical protein [Acidimicrobiales bacterium]
GTGVALGAGGAIWTRRRLEAMSARLRPAQLVGDRFRSAVDGGKADARRREEELRREFRLTEPAG